MADAVELVAKLNRFQDPEQIRIFLQQEGVTGETQDSESCVITNWIYSNCAVDSVSTDPTEIRIYHGNRTQDADVVIPVTECVKRFIDNFDNGYYPELVTQYEDDYDECYCSGCYPQYD